MRPTTGGVRRRRLAALLALVGLVAVAGCAAPVADPGTPTVETRGGDLGVDPGVEYDRLRTLVGTNVSAPARVAVANESVLPNRSAPGAVATPAPFAAFGVEPRPEERGELQYRYVADVGATGSIRVHPGEKPPALVRTILVHEYVHYLQVQRGDLGRLRSAVDTRSTDGAFVYRAVVEGIAVTVTDAYVREYLPEAEPNAALYETLDEVLVRGTPAWYGNARYRFGARYVDGRVADASAALEVVAAPPRTSEQVLHGHAPGAEPPLNVSVSVVGDTPWGVVGRDRMGEAFLLTALGDLPAERAREAAAGWGTDELLILRRSGTENASYALVTRWDTAADAREFAAAYRDALAERGRQTDAGWRVDGRTSAVRQTNETTVTVLVGPASFVADTSVAVEAGGVAVSPPEE